MKRQVTKTVDGVEQTVEETVEETRKHVEPGYLEAVYHLFSDGEEAWAGGASDAHGEPHRPSGIASLTPIWRRRSFRSAKSSIFTALCSRGIRICGAF